jgi:hypothetical protein
LTAFLVLQTDHLWADRVGGASCFFGALGVALMPRPVNRRWARLVWAGGLAALGAYLLAPSGDRPGMVGYGLALAVVLIVITIRLRRAGD